MCVVLSVDDKLLVGFDAELDVPTMQRSCFLPWPWSITQVIIYLLHQIEITQNYGTRVLIFSILFSFSKLRDLKPHNLLMDRKTMMLKIADLGLARAYTLPIKKYTHEVPVVISLYFRTVMHN